MRRACPVMRKVHTMTGPPALRRREAGFSGLARIIVGQQLSVASAAAIWARTEALIRPFEAARLVELTDEQMRGAGLSRPKIRTLRAAAAAAMDGLDLAALDHASAEDVHDALTAISGVGPWTADIFLMFCLGRADAWAPGDLALQVAIQMAFELDERPSADAITDIAERWRPWRAVAAHLLWAYYKVVKENRSGVPV